MRKRLTRGGWWRAAAVAGGTVLFLEGCDPTLRGTVEDGIITTSTSFFGALLRALIELGQEAGADTTTAAIVDAVGRVLA